MEPVQPPLSALTSGELMARAMEYRRMALTATSAEAREGLIQLAIEFVALATQRKWEERWRRVARLTGCG
jgi:hypothetical protein